MIGLIKYEPKLAWDPETGNPSLHPRGSCTLSVFTCACYTYPACNTNSDKALMLRGFSVTDTPHVLAAISMPVEVSLFHFASLNPR